MGAIESFLGFAKNLIIVESKVSELQKDVRELGGALETLTDKVATLAERVARIEGTINAYETIAARASGPANRKQLESGQQKKDE